ncbi:MAG: hypothetical protein ACFHWX_01575 [Bacteroidota bacterium]
MKTTLFILSLLVSMCLFSQSKEEDLVVLEQTAEWLEQKLTYNYYNIDDEEWWTNRFDYDPLTLKATIRNISAENLGAIQDRTHMQRVFQFGDLNPYNIYTEKTNTNSGRLVKGTTIRIGTYQQAKSISQMKNGAVPSTASFLYISIPKVYEDTASNYAESIVEKFEKAIMIATKVYPTGSFDGDTKQLIATLEDDRFLAENKENILITKIFPDVLELEHSDVDDNLIRKCYLKVDPGNQSVKWVGVKGLEPVTDIDLKFGSEEAYELKGEGFQLLFVNKHEIHFTEGGIESVFIRDNAYEKGRPYYR